MKTGALQPYAKAVLRPMAKLLWKFDVAGLENIPKDGPAILCPNHISVIDSFFVPAVVHRALIYVGKAEYLDDWKTRRLFPALGMIPIDRRGGEHAASALDAARGVLTSGGLFGIYPEGTRSRSGKLHKGHTGAARLAIETGAPIIPVGLIGTREIQPPDKALPKPFMKCTINFGEPVDPSRYEFRDGDRAVYRQMIDEVMFEIQALCGLEYEDTYAGAKAPAKPVEPAAPEPVVPIPVGVIAEPTIERKRSSDVLQSRPLVQAS